MAGIVFGEQAAKKIARTVRYVEDLRGNDPAKGKHKFRPQPGNNRILVQLTAALTAGSSAAGLILYHNGSSFVSSGKTVTVWDIYQNPYLPSASRVWCELYTGVWCVTYFQGTCIGVLDDSVSRTDTATVSVYSGSATFEADSNENITDVGGFVVPSGLKLASATRVTCQRASFTDSWQVNGADDCATT